MLGIRESETCGAAVWTQRAEEFGDEAYSFAPTRVRKMVRQDDACEVWWPVVVGGVADPQLDAFAVEPFVR